MKKILYAAFIGSISMIAFTGKAQVHIGVTIGSPAPVYVAPAPVWVPAGAPANPYYYFPDINCYYDMSIGQYIYFNNNAWVYSRAIPPRFAHYNFRRARMIPMNHRVFASRGIPVYHYNNGRRPEMRPNNYVMRNNIGHNWNNGHNGNHNGWNNGKRDMRHR